MKKLAQYVVALVMVALTHSSLLFVAILVAFMFTFSAPQGGEVRRTDGESTPSESVKSALHAGGWIGERAVAVLKFPMSTLDRPLPAFGGVWWLNSFLWAGFVVGGSKLVTSNRKKSNKPCHPTGISPSVSLDRLDQTRPRMH